MWTGRARLSCLRWVDVFERQRAPPSAGHPQVAAQLTVTAAGAPSWFPTQVAGTRMPGPLRCRLPRRRHRTPVRKQSSREPPGPRPRGCWPQPCTAWLLYCIVTVSDQKGSREHLRTAVAAASLFLYPGQLLAVVGDCLGLAQEVLRWGHFSERAWRAVRCSQSAGRFLAGPVRPERALAFP